MALKALYFQGVETRALSTRGQADAVNLHRLAMFRRGEATASERCPQKERRWVGGLGDGLARLHAMGCGVLRGAGG